MDGSEVPQLLMLFFDFSLEPGQHTYVLVVSYVENINLIPFPFPSQLAFLAAVVNLLKLCQDVSHDLIGIYVLLIDPLHNRENSTIISTQLI